MAARPSDPHLRHRKHGAIRPMHWKPRRQSRISTVLRAYRQEFGHSFTEELRVVAALVVIVTIAVAALP